MSNFLAEAENLISRLTVISESLESLGDVEAHLTELKKRQEVYYLNQATCLKRGLTRGDMEYLTPYYFEGATHAKYHIRDIESYEKTKSLKPKKRK